VRRTRLLLLVSICCSAAAFVHGAVEPPPPAVHALLINGGDRPASNYLSHLHHLEDLVDVLRRRGLAPERIHVFSADGQDPAADLTRRDVPPPEFWLIDGTQLGKRLRPQATLTDTRWAGVTLRPARQAALREWFEASRTRIAKGDRLLLFVTDHGTGDPKDPENNAISLWQEKLTVRELRALLARLPPGVQVVMVMSQCYSGAFANVAVDGLSDRDVCGFFSTTGAQKAYGCYAEGRDRDQMGHAFHFIDALRHKGTTAEAHVEVLADDDTPDAPLRTSDAYLARLVSAEAAARGVDEYALIDSLLAQAWRTPAGWEPEIRLLDRIGTAFGTFSPRRVAEIANREKELQSLTKQMATYADRWKVVQVEIQESLLKDFLAASADWRARLNANTIEALAAPDRASLLDELLPRLEEAARGRPEMWTKLDQFRDYAMRGAAARWRLEVRQAALQRMRSILVGIAGRVLIATGRPRDRDGLARLEACEAFNPGEQPDPGAGSRIAAPRPFPPLNSELALLEELSPSWLGVRFRPITQAMRTGRKLPAGANLLDAVYADSPAQRAGIEVGDIVLGLPGRPFDAPRELREWTMTSPKGVPLSLVVLRPGETAEGDREFEAELVLGPTPLEVPRPPSPPVVGERAPVLPAAVKVLGSSALPTLAGRQHLLFFWATWCGPCKKAVPEVMALARSRGMEAVAISDEDEETVSKFLADRAEPFLPVVAVDPLRKSFTGYGISGTPTLLLVDADGTIRHRQVGYGEKGLTLEGWSWPGR
jgi:thiol-disulfide isomerase/thioredoxin